MGEVEVPSVPRPLKCADENTGQVIDAVLTLFVALDDRLLVVLVELVPLLVGECLPG